MKGGGRSSLAYRACFPKQLRPVGLVVVALTFKNNHSKLVFLWICIPFESAPLFLPRAIQRHPARAWCFEACLGVSESEPNNLQPEPAAQSLALELGAYTQSSRVCSQALGARAWS